jgi:hypothetical protein
MKPLYTSQIVKYVGADGGISDATIEQVEGTNARVRIAPNHVALAAFNDDRKTPNTFHLAEDPAPAENAGEESKGFEPGGAPSGDQPTNS